ncbi:hypothetical protein AMJ39_04965 [candidate division TA06 bacterium DG_24]|uniref:PDZ domain-containing protein n=3 Tax=Bacteria division TA06 TaxID=1156500 RepID=A0A0S8JRV7_UNCT6|nr:MAG: hypothetical protein AMJ39_04965 [candidate division TA06 bacterium DG_24]KPK69425.1 MAG: hypothetical protein AMJ82_05580 [candidate division TA06 bacterium SM23_40]KPL11390.1 MAG: hypothetical protein AMJ71_01100 [candidate division TA06 bacterium SM1_40]
MRSHGQILSVPIVLILTAGAALGQGLADPYEILHKHYKAIGGLERLAAEETRYSEGTVTMPGMEGTIKQWMEPPARRREELDLKVFRQTTGDNGQVNWVVDTNGKLTIVRDEAAIARRKIETLLEMYDHLNPDSEHFTLSFEGIETVGTDDCYLVKIENTINQDIRYEYFDTRDLFLRKSLQLQPDMEIETLYSDYRQVNGVHRPFKMEVAIAPVGQTMTIQLATYDVGREFEPSLFEPPQQDVQDFSFTEGWSSEDIPFQYIEEHIYLNVSIGGKKTLWILDTGASVSVIDSAFAAELGLQPEGRLMGQGAGGPVEISFTTLPPYSIPGIEFSEQMVASLNIHDLFHNAFGLDVAGILGYDFLSRLVTKVDYANEKLSFYHPDRFEYHGDGTVLEAPLRENIFTVATTVDGKYSGKWRVDLGAGGVHLDCLPPDIEGVVIRRGIERVGRGAGGEFPVRNLRFRTIEFAGFVVKDPLISVPPGRCPETFGDAEPIGTLGNRLFQRFVLYLDYERQQLIVEKGADFNRTPPRDRSGLQIWLSEDDDMEVNFVSPDTPAAEAGFKKGDIIESINGISADYFAGVISVRELLREDAGTEYRFTILRDGKMKKLKMKLRDLY